MSSSLVVAAITEALRTLLTKVEEPLVIDPTSDSTLSGADVTTLPPKQVPLNDGKHRLNLFLFQLLPNVALRNLDVPARSAPGIPAPLGVALDLYYLISAYGAQNSEIASHRLLGRAVALLGDGNLIPNVRFALQQNAVLQDSGQQLEQIRIVPHPLSIDDMSKLWTMFQSDYRLSVCYRVTVAVIDPLRPAAAALPVLSTGVSVQLDVGPRLDVIVPPFARTSAVLGDIVTLGGTHLTGELKVRLRHVGAGLAFELPPLRGGSRTELRFTLPANAGGWLAGLYTVSVTWIFNGVSCSSNELPLAIAARLLSLTPNPIDLGVTSTIHATCSAVVPPEQRVSLLVGGRELAAAPRSASTQPLTFGAAGLQPGTYIARLRVDGIDSPVTDDAAAPLLEFSASAPRLTVTGSPP